MLTTDSPVNLYWDRLCAQGAEKIKSLLCEGNRRHLVVKRENDLLLDIPVNFAVVGAIVAPRVVAVGAIGALLAHCSVGVERTVEPVLDVREPG